MNIRENIIESKPDKLVGTAAILQSIPPSLIYWGMTFVTIFLAFLGWLLATWLAAIALSTFALGVGLLAFKLVKGAHRSYHEVMRTGYETNEVKERYRKLHIANETALAKLEMQRQLPRVIIAAMENGNNIEYGGLKVTDWRSNIHMLQDNQTSQIAAPASPLPTMIRYEEIRGQIPEGHNLVGISDAGLITKADKHIGACVWIIGGSGSGKTTTTSLRLEERAVCGHSFYGVDPHWYKDDSLTNAIVGFSDRFLLPMARDTKETKRVLETFLKEFQDRKAGKVAKPFSKVTLVVDEVGSLNDPQAEEDEEVLKLLKTITRICGQEARNFEMGGIFISQQATGLFWIGNVALLVIVHKLLKENQQKLATQCDDKELFAAMRLWPKGRTYVYGMGLEEGEGCLVLQQPYFEKPAAGEWHFEELRDEEPVSTATDEDIVYEACMQLRDENKVPTVRAVAAMVPFGKTKVAEIMTELKAQGCEI